MDLFSIYRLIRFETVGVVASQAGDSMLARVEPREMKAAARMSAICDSREFLAAAGSWVPHRWLPNILAVRQMPTFRRRRIDTGRLRGQSTTSLARAVALEAIFDASPLP
jgi:hypothetical protein